MGVDGRQLEFGAAPCGEINVRATDRYEGRAGAQSKYGHNKPGSHLKIGRLMYDAALASAIDRIFQCLIPRIRIGGLRKLQDGWVSADVILFEITLAPAIGPGQADLSIAEFFVGSGQVA